MFSASRVGLRWESYKIMLLFLLLLYHLFIFLSNKGWIQVTSSYTYLYQFSKRTIYNGDTSSYIVIDNYSHQWSTHTCFAQGFSLWQLSYLCLQLFCFPLILFLVRTCRFVPKNCFTCVCIKTPRVQDLIAAWQLKLSCCACLAVILELRRFALL